MICDIRHLLDNFQARTFAILFASLCVRVDNLIMELAHSLLQPTMALNPKEICVTTIPEGQRHPYLLVVGAVVALH
jgi:hypothetical protein